MNQVNESTTPPQPHRRSRRGFTLVELMLALTITMFIGGAVSSMLSAVSYGTESEAGRRSANTRKTIMRTKLNACLRSTRLVLDEGEIPDAGIHFLILWTGDSTYNDLPNVSEIMLLEYHRKTGMVYAYRAPDDLPPAYNIAFPLTTDFESLTSAMASKGIIDSELWATNVSSWGVNLNAATPQEATSAAYTMGIQSNEYTANFSGNVAFRSR